LESDGNRRIRARSRLHTSSIRATLPDIAVLLTELNALRKSESYGEIRPSESLDPEDIAVEVEEYFEAVAALFREES
jgi:hypothetical protein